MLYDLGGDTAFQERIRHERREHHHRNRHALQTLARADQILDDVTPQEGNDEDDDVVPWQAAHVWIFRAMCLLIDSLDGVETVTFSPEEKIPVARTTQPYTYLSDRYVAIADRYKGLAQDHESLARELASPDDDE